MKKDAVLTTLEDLISYLELALKNIDTNSIEIIKQLEHWKLKISLDEIKTSVSEILNNVVNWEKRYKNNYNIMDISLKEYDFVSKESSYILGECALIDGIYSDVINHLVLCVGAELCEKLRNGGKTNG